MADIKISELPVATVVNDTDVLVINQGTTTKQATRSLVNAASGTLAVANGGTGRTVGNYSVYGLEIHVGKDGNDTTGDGTLINPVLTITKALTLVGSGRNTIVVHPGEYSESPTVSGTNTTIRTTELTGANTLLSGTLTLNAAARVSGLKMSNLAITGTGNAYISNCTVDVNVTKSGSNYVEIINSELQCTSGIQITGTGTVSIIGNKCWAVAVSNAAANVLLKDCFQVVAPSVSAGTLQFDGCAIFGSAPSTNAVSSSAGTTITLANSFVLNSVGTNAERVSLLGSYSILNLVYDKANSTLTGTNLNAIDHFSVINADTLNLTNDLSVADGGTGQSSYTDGQLLIGNSTGNTLAKANLTAGTNVTITNGPGTITINALAGTLAIANGGTGETTAEAAKRAMGGVQTVQSVHNVSVAIASAGTVTLTTTASSPTVTYSNPSIALAVGMSFSTASIQGAVIRSIDSGGGGIGTSGTLTMTSNASSSGGPASGSIYTTNASWNGTAAPVFDGRTPVTGDIVILTAQVAAAVRGPWVVTNNITSYAYTRPAWFSGTLTVPMLCNVQYGTVFSGAVVSVTAQGALITGVTTIGIDSLSIFTSLPARSNTAQLGTNLFTGYQSFRSNGAGANAAPFFFQAGAALMTAPQAHAVEWFNDTLFLTTAAGVRTTNVVSTTIPATSTSAGIVGQTAIDNSNNWFYVCTATNVWKRIALTTF